MARSRAVRGISGERAVAMSRAGAVAHPASPRIKKVTRNTTTLAGFQIANIPAPWEIRTTQEDVLFVAQLPRLSSNQVSTAPWTQGRAFETFVQLLDMMFEPGLIGLSFKSVEAGADPVELLRAKIDV